MAVMNRKCLACNYVGPMKTWLSHYNGPQFIALILMFFYLLPGLIFVAWGWGKYKCPKCGALAKNSPDTGYLPSSDDQAKKCPFCAELIKNEAIKCRYCGSDIPTAVVEAETVLQPIEKTGPKCPDCGYMFDGKYGKEGWWCPNCNKANDRLM